MLSSLNTSFTVYPSMLVERKKGPKVQLWYLYILTKVIPEGALCKKKPKRIYITAPTTSLFLHSFHVMGFASSLFFSARGLCYYPRVLFSDAISGVGHYRRAGWFLEGVIKCCGGMVISVKMPEERSNVKMQEVVVRKPSWTVENGTIRCWNFELGLHSS